jgi:hypothetical protein
MEIFPQIAAELLDVSLKAGQITWEEGLRCTGNGLYTGIAGNGYLLHTLYRTLNKLAENEKDD